jgi:hypothetical protein
MSYENYVIDLGFNGNYWDDRTGVFCLVVLYGDFREGILYERFLTRSTKEIKDRIDIFKILFFETYESKISAYAILDDQVFTFKKDDLLQI